MIYGRHYVSGDNIAIKVESGKLEVISYMNHAQLMERSQIKWNNTDEFPIIAPGLIDLQINGYLGEDFNQLPLSEDSIIRFCHHMWSLGVVRFYPTLITNSFEALLEALLTIARVCERHEQIHYAIAGIHLEGPFISPKEGSRGAHDQRYICPPSIEWMERWQLASGNRIKIVTMSPEWENSISFIHYCYEQNIIVSIGHTAATSEQIAAAVAAGASMVTHFGNGVQLQLPRHPNYLWEQLAQDSLYTCAIADSYHLPEQVLKVIYKVKQDKMILVSDAVSLAGSAPGSYTTFVGGEVKLTEYGKLHLANNEKLLAGSVAALIDGVNYMLRAGIACFKDCWHMASINPALLLKLHNHLGLSNGAPADFVLLSRDDEGKMHVQQTYVQGQCMYQRS